MMDYYNYRCRRDGLPPKILLTAGGSAIFRTAFVEPFHLTLSACSKSQVKVATLKHWRQWCSIIQSQRGPVDGPWRQPQPGIETVL